MRHGISGNKLGRNSSLRQATIRDLAKATLICQRVCTTKAKAKEARKLVDRLITLGKKGGLSHKRRAFAILCDHKLVSELFRKTAARFRERKGGYTRIIPLSLRRGDNAQLAYLELTEKEEVIISKPRSAATAKAKTLDVLPDAKKPGEAPGQMDGKDKEEKKPSTPKKHTKDQEKGLAGKKFVGGIKKMFQRKTGAE
jgi:large subunit ribosomal protein L17